MPSSEYSAIEAPTGPVNEIACWSISPRSPSTTVSAQEANASSSHGSRNWELPTIP